MRRIRTQDALDGGNGWIEITSDPPHRILRVKSTWPGCKAISVAVRLTEKEAAAVAEALKQNPQKPSSSAQEDISSAWT